MERSIFPILTQRAKGPGIVLLGLFRHFFIGIGNGHTGNWRNTELKPGISSMTIKITSLSFRKKALKNTSNRAEQTVSNSRRLNFARKLPNPEKRTFCGLRII